MLLSLILISVVDFSSIFIILKYFLNLLKNTIFILFVIYFIIFIFQLFIKNKVLLNFLEKGSYLKRLLVSIFIWILSSWPVYLWYGFLRSLYDKWLTLWHIASFSYARAIKIPLFPIMIMYFWVKYLFLFILFLLIFSFLQSLIFDFLLFKKNNEG